LALAPKVHLWPVPAPHPWPPKRTPITPPSRKVFRKGFSLVLNRQNSSGHRPQKRRTPKNHLSKRARPHAATVSEVREPAEIPFAQFFNRFSGQRERLINLLNL